MGRGGVRVSCIMPTGGRPMFAQQAVGYFLRQRLDQPEAQALELIVVDDGRIPIRDLLPEHDSVTYVRADRPLTLGAKRNLACERARGEWIAHWDDDDWHAPDRLAAQLRAAIIHDADGCGVPGVYYLCPRTARSWIYRPMPGDRTRLVGGTLLYRRSLWERHRFPDRSVGEDAELLRRARGARWHALDDLSLYVAVLHGGNASAKNLADARFERVPVSEVTRLLGADRSFYVGLRHAGSGRVKAGIGHDRPEARLQLGPARRRSQGLARAAAASRPAADGRSRGRQGPSDHPLVSCVMPTYDRRRFVSQAIAHFLAQDYPNRELVIVDDGPRDVADLVPDDARVRLIRLDRRHSIGFKRNLGCEAARGEIVVGWDDDDWHAPNRVGQQVEPLLRDLADVTGISNTLVFSAASGRFWQCSPSLHSRMYNRSIVGATLTFRRSWWLAGLRYPDASLAEDVGLQEALRHAGARFLQLPNRGCYVVVRHDANTWKWEAGRFLGSNGWTQVAPPPFLSADDLASLNVLFPRLVSARPPPSIMPAAAGSPRTGG